MVVDDDVNRTESEAEKRLREAMTPGRAWADVHRAYRGPDGSQVIEISRATFGNVDFTSLSLPPLVLRHCGFGTLILDHSRAPRVELEDCTVQNLSARGLVLYSDDGDLLLTRVTVTGVIDLGRARVGGRFVCRAVTILGEGSSGDGSRAVLACRRLSTAGDVDLVEGCYVNGEIDFVGAEIGGTFTYTGRIDCRDGVALRCNGIHVTRGLRIGNPDDPSEVAVVSGEVSVIDASVEGDVNLTNARLDNPDGKAIDAERMTVGGDLYLDRGFVARGLVRLVGAQVAGLVNCIGGAFTTKRGYAIDADGLVATSVYLNSGSGGRGRVRSS